MQRKNILKFIILFFSCSTKAAHYTPTITLFSNYRDSTNQPSKVNHIQKIDPNIINANTSKHIEQNIFHSINTTKDQEPNIIIENSHPIINTLNKSDNTTTRSLFFKLHTYTKKQYQLYHQWHARIQKINMRPIFSHDIKQNTTFVQSQSLHSIDSILRFFLQKIMAYFCCKKKETIEQSNQKKDLPQTILPEPHYSIVYMPNSYIKTIIPNSDKIEIKNNSTSSSDSDEDYFSFSDEQPYSEKENTNINLAIVAYAPNDKKHQISLNTLCNDATKKIPWFIIKEAKSLNHPIVTKMIYPKFNPVKIAFIPKAHGPNYQDNDIFESFSDSDSFKSFSDSDCEDESFSGEESDSEFKQNIPLGSDELHNKVENTKKTNQKIQDIFWDMIAHFVIKKIDTLIK